MTKLTPRVRGLHSALSADQLHSHILVRPSGTLCPITYANPENLKSHYFCLAFNIC